MIKAVLFDLDGTLYDRDAAMVTLAHDQFEAFRNELQPRVDEERFTSRFIELDDHGYASRSDVYRRLSDELGLDNWLTVDLERHFWEAYSRRCDISSDTWNTLQTLRRRQMPWHRHERSDRVAVAEARRPGPGLVFRRRAHLGEGRHSKA